jgi:hypothetical protein
MDKGRRIFPALAILLIFGLGFLAFSNGFGLMSPTGLVALENSTLTGSFNINKDTVQIPAERTIVRFSAPEVAKIITKNGAINGTGSFWIDDFAGTIEWDGKNIVLDGTMASVHGGQLDITYSTRAQSQIILKSGSVQAETVNISSFNQRLTGNLRLENRWNIKMNNTPLGLYGYEGSINIQKVGNDTTLLIAGRTDSVRVEQENVLKNVA